MLKKAVSEAAGESKPEAYPQGYVEDFDEPRTKLEDFFSILLNIHRLVYFGEGGLCDFRGALAAVLYDLVDA